MTRAAQEYEAMSLKELQTASQQLTGLISDKFEALSEQFSRTPAVRLLIAETRSAVNEQQIVLLSLVTQLQELNITVLSEHRKDLMTLLGSSKT